MEPTIDALPTPLDVPGDTPWSARIHLCSQRWDALASTTNARERHCGVCDRAVVLVVDVDGYQQAAVDRRCIAVEATKASDATTDPKPRMYLGDRLAPEWGRRDALTWD